MLDMHTPLSLNLRQWFSIGVVTYLLTYRPRPSLQGKDGLELQLG
jgi:hypothetical protein